MSSSDFLDPEQILVFKHEFITLGLSLSDLHSSFNEGDLSQIDYDVYYHSYCLAMAKIKRSIWLNDKKAAMSL